MKMRHLSVDDIWADLEADEASIRYKRVDEQHPADFFACVDQRRRLGLMLMSREEPKRLPRLSNIEITSETDAPGHWVTSIWLADRGLQPLFSALCTDLIDDSRGKDSATVAQTLSDRLLRWRRLLEMGSLAVLPNSELAGLLGELTVLKEAISQFGAGEAVKAWSGPLGAPQDFAFERNLLEVKAVGPTALRVRISNPDQLDATRPLVLAVVTIARVSSDSPSGVSVRAYVNNISSALESNSEAMDDFESRLRAAGYSGNEDYEKIFIRIDDVRFFEVRPDFPKLVRSDLMAGISNALYDIELSAIKGFEVEVGF